MSADDIVYLPPDPVLEFRVVTEASFPLGVRCARCNRVLVEGQPFDTRPDDTSEIETIVCVYCPAEEGGAS